MMGLRLILPLIDEDGRCRFSGLLPGECACDQHRGGNTPEEEAKIIDIDRLVSKFFIAAYPGYCLPGKHKFEAEAAIAYYFDGEGIPTPYTDLPMVCREHVNGDFGWNKI